MKFQITGGNKEKIFLIFCFKTFTSSGRVATSGAQISDVKDVPVATKIVLTWI